VKKKQDEKDYSDYKYLINMIKFNSTTLEIINSHIYSVISWSERFTFVIISDDVYYKNADEFMILLNNKFSDNTKIPNSHKKILEKCNNTCYIFINYYENKLFDNLSTKWLLWHHKFNDYDKELFNLLLVYWIHEKFDVINKSFKECNSSMDLKIQSIKDEYAVNVKSVDERFKECNKFIDLKIQSIENEYKKYDDKIKELNKSFNDEFEHCNSIIHEINSEKNNVIAKFMINRQYLYCYTGRSGSDYYNNYLCKMSLGDNIYINDFSYEPKNQICYCTLRFLVRFTQDMFSKYFMNDCLNMIRTKLNNGTFICKYCSDEKEESKREYNDERVKALIISMTLGGRVDFANSIENGKITKKKYMDNDCYEKFYEDVSTINCEDQYDRLNSTKYWLYKILKEKNKKYDNITDYINDIYEYVIDNIDKIYDEECEMNYAKEFVHKYEYDELLERLNSLEDRLNKLEKK